MSMAEAAERGTVALGPYCATSKGTLRGKSNVFGS